MMTLFLFATTFSIPGVNPKPETRNFKLETLNSKPIDLPAALPPAALSPPAVRDNGYSM